MSAEKTEKMGSSDDQPGGVSATTSRNESPVVDIPPMSFGAKLIRELTTWGSAVQIILSAALAVAIGLTVTATVDEVPEEAIALLAIPGTLWLRALKAVVLPLIVTAMIIAVQRLREMSGSGKLLARWVIGYYILTTLVAIIQSSIMVSQVWSKMMTVVPTDEAEDEFSSEEQKETFESREDTKIHEVVVQMFESLIPKNVVNSLATDDLLAVIIASIVVGALIRSSNSIILKLVKEVERIITIIISFLIMIAPIGVFFLILPNLFRLDIKDVGQNLGVLIGGALCDMAIHLFVILPLIFFIFTRSNPFSYWLKNSKAWITAWGTASSAATLSVTLRCAKDRGIPTTIAKFALPLGCLINMDGTAIYFPVVVVFMAATQGIQLTAANYVIICLLSTLASIGTTPIPSSSLVLTVMIANAVDVPVTGMYAAVVAIDWFLDRFRTAVNVSGDLYAVACVTKATGITDPDDMVSDEEEEVGEIRADSRV